MYSIFYQDDRWKLVFWVEGGKMHVEHLCYPDSEPDNWYSSNRHYNACNQCYTDFPDGLCTTYRFFEP